MRIALNRFESGLHVVRKRSVQPEHLGAVAKDGCSSFGNGPSNVRDRRAAPEISRVGRSGENRIIHIEIRPAAFLPLQNRLQSCDIRDEFRRDLRRQFRRDLLKDQCSGP